MTVDAIEIKKQLLKKCKEYVDLRILTAKQTMDHAQLAANGEEKSSAGDKYETSRAMSHLEKDMHARQLMNNMQELAVLRAVNVDAVYSTVATGAFVKCEIVSFFIAAGLGKQLVDKVPIIFLSPESPLAKKNGG